MGIEYEHWFFVRDLGWIGADDAAQRVEGVLDQWGLVSAHPTVFDIERGRRRKVRPAKTFPSNALVVYPFVDDPRVLEIMGPSLYPEDQIGPRYFQEIRVVLGCDYRLLNAHERGQAEVLEPPRREGAPILPLPETFERQIPAHLSYPGASVTTPPRARFAVDRAGLPLSDSFTGVWRSGIGLDCGKDLPAFAETSTCVPGRAFTDDLARALGTELLEYGWFY